MFVNREPAEMTAEYKYNPQNEMFSPSKTKRSIRKNETYLKSPFFKKISTRLRRVS